MSTTTAIISDPPLDRYRTMWQRFWAACIDSLIFLPLGFLNVSLSRPQHSAASLICWTIVWNNCLWIYTVAMHARSGQTIGKKIMDVKVLDVTEQRIPTLGQALLRDIGSLAASLILTGYAIFLIVSHRYSGPRVEIYGWLGWLFYNTSETWFWVEIITALLNKKRRALHDFIARTVVVYEG